MFDPSLTYRIHRLLYGELRLDNLAEIFLALRDLPFVGECVREIGDFVAHRGKRERGLVTGSARDFFTTFLFVYSASEKKPDQLNLPANIVEVLEACFRRMDEKPFYQQFGRRKIDAKPILRSLTPKLTKLPDGRISLESATDDEKKLANVLMSNFTSKPAFNAHQLHAELYIALLQNHLCKPDDQRAFSKIKDVITVFALERLHYSSVVLADNSRACLWLAYNSESCLEIEAELEIPERKSRFAYPMFITQLKIADWCDEGLLSVRQDKTLDLKRRATVHDVGSWRNVPLELAPSNKIVRLFDVVRRT